MGAEWVAIIALVALFVVGTVLPISEPVYYKQILTYGVIVTLVGPLAVWAALVLPGWGS